ncbi:MAG: 3-methyl-2-oxobutanoate hydroxymethyltransferase [Chthoniobacterales bacterium]
MSKITPDTILKRKGTGQRIVALTTYDYPTARLLDEAAVDLLLVGDSLGMTILGHPDTTQVRIEDVIHHTKAVARGVRNALVATDLPIHTYDDAASAVVNAARLIEVGANAVKLEGGQACFQQASAIIAGGIPLIGHIGMLPQHVHEEGGYRIKGKTASEREFLIEEALAIESAGAFAVVLELVHPPVAREITSLIKIPTIGIGSGHECNGEIQVFHDLVGYFPWFRPKHVRPTADVAGEIRKAVAVYISQVRGE